MLILLLVDELQVLGVDRLHANVNVGTRSCHQVEDLRVIPDVGRAEAGETSFRGRMRSMISKAWWRLATKLSSTR